MMEHTVNNGEGNWQIHSMFPHTTSLHYIQSGQNSINLKNHLVLTGTCKSVERNLMVVELCTECGRSHFDHIFLSSVKYKCKSILLTGREGPCGCETSRLPHFLNNRFTDISFRLYAPAALTPRRLLVLVSVRGWFEPWAIVRLERLGQLWTAINSSGIKSATFRLVA
jgi:hypothetical protein